MRSEAWVPGRCRRLLPVLIRTITPAHLGAARTTSNWHDQIRRDTLTEMGRPDSGVLHRRSGLDRNCRATPLPLNAHRGGIREADGVDDDEGEGLAEEVLRRTAAAMGRVPHNCSVLCASGASQPPLLTTAMVRIVTLIAATLTKLAMWLR